MTDIVRYVLHLFRSVVRILWGNTAAISNKYNIFIKSNTGSTISVDINPKWDIRNVKNIIAPKLGTKPEEVKIIFAGKELGDDIMIEECDLGQQSVLHVVNTKNKPNTISSSTNWKYEHILTDNAVRDDDHFTGDRVVKKPYFYIYCGSVCKSLQIGKLRVRCRSCKSGAVIVDSDPKSWFDVLTEKQISCSCNQDGCDPDEIYKWAEFYFKCANHISIEESDVIIPLPLIKNNFWDVSCLACTDIRTPVLVYPCEEKHVTCVDCFILYASTRLRDRQFTFDEKLGYTLPCPVGCQYSYIEDCNYFKLLTKEQYETYQRFATEEYVLKGGGVLCPQPSCGAGIMTDENCRRVICTNGCGYVFCRKCLQGYHIGDCSEVNQNEDRADDCTLSPEQILNARWNEASRIKIRESSKPCPQCRTPTEKSGGCMHMICSRCNFEWCWVCQIKWGRECMSLHWFD